MARAQLESSSGPLRQRWWLNITAAPTSFPDLLGVALAVAWLGYWAYAFLTHPQTHTFTNTLDLTIGMTGLVFAAAFLSLSVQLDALIGDEGILPLPSTLRDLDAMCSAAPPPHLSKPDTFLYACAARMTRVVTWLCRVGSKRRPSAGPRLRTLAHTCATLSLISALLPTHTHTCVWLTHTLRVCVLVTCTLVYHAHKRVCGPFLALQWDQLLLEVGSLAAITASLLPFAKHHATSTFLLAVPWQVLAFRLMFGAGWVKLACGEPTWRDLTAMSYHFMTQPLPTYMGYKLHACTPMLAHKINTGIALATELLVPLAMLAPVACVHVRVVCYLLLCSLQTAIATTGHYGFFNVLSCVVCLPTLPDAALPFSLQSDKQLTTRGPFCPPLIATTSLLLLLISLVGLLNTLTRYTTDTPVCACVTSRKGLPGYLHSLGGILLHAGGHYGLFARMTTVRDEVVVEVQAAPEAQDVGQQAAAWSRDDNHAISGKSNRVYTGYAGSYEYEDLGRTRKNEGSWVELALRWAE